MLAVMDQPVKDKSELIAVIAGMCIALLWIVTLLRCYVRICLKRFFGADDALSIVATITFTIGCASMIHGSIHHVWRPESQLSRETYELGLMLFFIGKVVYGFTTWVMKISFSITLLRIDKNTTHIYAVYTVIAIMTGLTIFYLVFIITTCSPVAFYWLRAVSTNGLCRNPNDIMIVSYVHGFVIFASDFTLAIVPIFMVKSLNIDKPLKLTAIFLLALGSFTSVATIARIPYIHRLSNFDNYLYKNIEIVIWSGLEIFIGVFATGAATLRPLITKFGSIAASSSSSSDHHRRGRRRRRSSFSRQTSRKSSPRPALPPKDHIRDIAGYQMPDIRENEVIRDLEAGGSSSSSSSSSSSDSGISSLVGTRSSKDSNPPSIDSKSSIDLGDLRLGVLQFEVVNGSRLFALEMEEELRSPKSSL